LKEILDTITTSEKVVFVASSQVAKTEALLNTIGYYAHLDPCPIMVLQPTIEMAETISKDRIAPMLRDTPVLMGLVAQKRSKDSDNTILHKSFSGGALTLSGANSPASLASRPIRVLLVDECDRFPQSAGREGDPIKLATKRTTTYWNRRIVIVSTPTLKGSSRIEYEYGLSDKRKYFVPCPHCGEFQTLIWPQFKWSEISLDGNKHCQEAWYECINCEGKITEGQKNDLLLGGQWRATAKGKTPGFHVWQAYSPWSSFKGIVQEFLDCKGDREMLKTFINTVLGESFDDLGGEGLSWRSLLARCEPFSPLSVPAGGLILTAGVDVQKDRLAVSVWAWGKAEESWLIYHSELFGDPINGQDQCWQNLDAVLTANYSHQSGSEMVISAACIDTGYQNQVVYNYVRTRAKVYAVKGQSQANKPILGRPSYQEVNYKGKVIKQGVKLWPVGSDTIKSLIYQRLRIIEAGAGFFHFPIGIDQEYFEQLTAEKVVTKFTRGFARREWVKVRSRNESLDCLVYAYAAAHIAGITRANWDKLAKSLDVPEVSEPPSTNSEKVSKPPSKNTSSWINGVKKGKW
jgi:phage terminase large subunit GpA-like protein